MSNFNVKINLMRVKGASLVNLKGTYVTKQCIVIPVEDSGLFIGEKGVYLNLQAIELKEAKYDQTHLVKMDVDSDTYKAMTEEEKNAIPIVGSMKKREFQSQPMQATETAEFSGGDNADDLPF